MGAVKGAWLDLLDWAERQAREGVRYDTGKALWQAADAVRPGLLPAEPLPLSRDWPLMRELTSAYCAGLGAVAVGDRVWFVSVLDGQRHEGEITAVWGEGTGVRVRPDGWGTYRDAPNLKRQVDVGRMAVRKVE